MIRDLVPLLGPSWLVKDRLPDGTECDSRVLYAVGLLCDALLERLQLGVEAQHPELAPDDALPRIARDRGILRGPDEPRASLEVRLTRALTDARVKGTAWALHDQIRGFCQPYSVRVATVDQRGTWKQTNYDGARSTTRGTAWDWDGATPFEDYRGRFWVLVYPRAAEPIFERVKWGARKWGATNATWGTTATPAQGRGLMQLLKTWKPAGTRPLFLIGVDPDSTDFEPTETAPPLPDGTWGDNHVMSAGIQVPARSLDGKYSTY